MKKLLASLALGLSLLTGGAVALAQAPTAAPAASEAAAPAAAAATAALAADTAAPPAPAAAATAATSTAPASPAAPVAVPNKVDSAWMMVSTMLVILMIPGLALFYGGLVRSKNMLSVLMQVMVTF